MPLRARNVRKAPFAVVAERVVKNMLHLAPGGLCAAKCSVAGVLRAFVRASGAKCCSVDSGSNWTDPGPKLVEFGSKSVENDRIRILARFYPNSVDVGPRSRGDFGRGVNSNIWSKSIRCGRIQAKIGRSRAKSLHFRGDVGRGWSNSGHVWLMSAGSFAAPLDPPCIARSSPVY